MKKISKVSGFTIIELMVVVVIMGLLSSIIITSLAGSRAKGRDGQRISDLHQLQLALTLFFDRCGQYPLSMTSGASLRPSDTSLTADTCPNISGNTLTLSDFISKIPTPPGGTPYSYYPISIYYTTNSVVGKGVSYVLVTTLEKDNAAMGKSLLSIEIKPDPADTHWKAPANAPPFSFCGTLNNGYYYYCIGPN